MQGVSTLRFQFGLGNRAGWRLVPPINGFQLCGSSSGWEISENTSFSRGNGVFQLCGSSSGWEMEQVGTNGASYEGVSTLRFQFGLGNVEGLPAPEEGRAVSTLRFQFGLGNLRTLPRKPSAKEFQLCGSSSGWEMNVNSAVAELMCFNSAVPVRVGKFKRSNCGREIAE